VPRFSIKDLLLSISLIALGLGTIVFSLTLESPFRALGSYGLPLIGAGGLTLFGRTWTGAGVGCLLYFVLVVIFIVYGY
jgi:hypothetical protein